MAEEPRSPLERAGLPAEDAARLAELSEEARAFLPGEHEEAHWLRGLVTAAVTPELGARALPVLRAALEARAGSLQGVERAVLSHFRALALRAETAGLDDVPRALRHLEASLADLDVVRSPEAGLYRGRVLDTLGQFLQQQGQLSDARLAFERALHAKEEAGDAAGTALTLGNLGRLCLALGDFSDACGHLERDLAWVDSRQPPGSPLRAQLMTEIGLCLLEDGDLEAAEARLQRALEEADAIGNLRCQAFAAAYLGHARLRAGRTAEAGELADRVEGLVASRSLAAYRELSGLLDFLRAELHAEAGRLSEALDAFARAREAYDLSPRMSAIERAGLLAREAATLRDAGRERDAATRLREAMRHLDATSAESLRAILDVRLRGLDEGEWMLHGSGRFIGHDQIRFLLDEGGQAGFRGEEAELCILFSDLRDFTTLSEGLSPDTLVAFLNRYLSGMTRCVEHYDGHVDKFIGDAVMALFTLPRPRADDADRALAAALYMQIELARLNRSRAPGVPRLSSGIGLHAGSVVAGLIGSPQKRSYTVIGDAVNTASRLEGMTKLLGAPVLVSGDLVSRLRTPERWILVPLGCWRPKGRKQAVEVFHLAGEDDGGPEVGALRARAARAKEVLARLRARDFAGAAADLARLEAEADVRSGAPGYARLAREARRCAEAPPGEDWDGAIPLQEK